MENLQSTNRIEESSLQQPPKAKKKKGGKKSQKKKMSRGGRGNRGRGRLPGDWVNDFEKLKSENSEQSSLFPPYNVPTAAPPTEQEKREVANYKQFRDEMHEGPFYVKTKKLDPKEAAKSYAAGANHAPIKTQSDVDPFTGVPTYSMKYDKKRNAVPQLTGPFNKELFPEELWPTLEGKEGEAVRNTINSGMRRKAQLQARMSRVTGEMTAEEREKKVLEKFKNVTEDEVEGDAELDDEAEPEEEDYDYVDDEEELGDDYNAEKYFDGGDGDDDDGGDGGDDY